MIKQQRHIYNSTNEHVCKTSVAKNPGKTLLFFKNFWNHETEEFSLGVIMEDVQGRTIPSNTRAISLFLKTPREDSAIS